MLPHTVTGRAEYTRYDLTRHCCTPCHKRRPCSASFSSTNLGEDSAPSLNMPTHTDAHTSYLTGWLWVAGCCCTLLLHVRSSDFYEYLLHHVVTIFLVTVSFYCRIQR